MHADQEVITTEVPISNTLVEEISKGGLWQYQEWEIHHNKEITRWQGLNPCEHASDIYTRKHPGHGSSPETLEHWTVPRVLVAYNEGGYASTGICLDCILEAAK